MYIDVFDLISRLIACFVRVFMAANNMMKYREYLDDATMGKMLISALDDRPDIEKHFTFDMKREETRLMYTPIYYDDLHQLGKDHSALIWTAREIKVTKAGWQELQEPEQFALKRVICFLGVSDNLVSANINKNFKDFFPIQEVMRFFNIQNYMEDVHSNQYANIMDSLIMRAEVLQILKESCIDRKVKWVEKFMNTQIDLRFRLVAFLLVEGIFFSSSFAIIFWIRYRGKLETLAAANDLIFRDENIHCVFTATLYNYLSKSSRLSQKSIHKMFTEAIEIEMDFFKAAIPNDLPNMSHQLMAEHIQNRANTILKFINYEPLYEGVKEPFAFMENSHLTTHVNLHERASSNYMLNVPEFTYTDVKGTLEY